MDSKEKFYITTAIAYASRKPHIGNTYEVIMTDAIARFKKLLGYDVFFLTGTDEHGQKIEDLAKEQGISPQQYVDGVAGEIRAIWDLMDADYDHFIRTTDDYHVKAVQNIFKKLYDKGDIYKSEYEGHYCVPCESFFTETQAPDGKCPDCGAPLKKTKEEAYFFKMSAYQDRLIEHIENNPGFIEPESRKKEMLNNFLRAGLQDLCVSRSSFTWGIPVSFDEKHVTYVWIDALSNYITALGYDTEGSGEKYKKYWPCDVHIIGKDIMRFHSIYWPIILMALGEPLPKKIFGHPWFLFGNDKMSKSKGNVLYADSLAERFGVDAVRHYCLSEMPYGNDGSITPESIIARYNTDLANNLGNLVSRSVAMTEKYFGGIIPAPTQSEAVDGELAEFANATKERVTNLMNSYRIADASAALFELFGRANKYIDQTTPWVLAKDEADRERLGTVMYNLLEAIRFGSVLLECFLPSTAKNIFAQLGTDCRSLCFGALAAGGSVKKGPALFERLDEQKVLAEMEAESAPKKPLPKAEPLLTETVDFDSFMKTDIRAAKILSCESVPKSQKLLKFTVDIGFETRQVVSGIAKFYRPEELIGKTVAFVANLKPIKLMGIESHGMILASGDENVRVVFLDDSAEAGDRIH